MSIVDEKSLHRFGNPEKRTLRARERTFPRSRKPRRTRPPHISPKFRETLLYRVRWERDGGWPNRSRRFSTRRGAVRFYNVLFDEDSQKQYGEVEWATIEYACAFIGPWKRVSS